MTIDKRARREIFNLKPYVPGKPISEVKRELGIADVIKLASNENPLGPSPMAKKAIVENLDAISLYPDGNCYLLREAICRHYGVGPGQLLLGNGSDEILKMVSETFLSPGTNIVYARPTFSEYEFTATIMGAECREVPLKEHRHDLKAMLERVDDDTRIMYICNPNNPTGTIVTGKEVRALMDRIPEHVLVIFDEAYGEYAEDERYESGLTYLNEGRNVMVLHTFSKIYGLAGLRIGYAFSTPEVCSLVERVREPFNVNLLAQEAAAAALVDREHVERSRRVNSEGKHCLYDEFTRMGLTFIPTEANFVMVNLGMDCRQVFNALLRLGVIVRSGDVFGYHDWIRVTVGTAEENRRLIAALREVLGR